MCAIYGIVKKKGGQVDLNAVRRMVEGNMRRGPHAFGFAWIDQAGRLHAFKQKGRMSDHWPLLFRAVQECSMLIGHLRWTTHGSEDENINNHPHASDGGWIVHNGVVGNHEELIREHELLPVSECDSEVLGLLIERASGRFLRERMAEAVNLTSGGLAMLGLWSRPGRVVVARRGNPLCIADTPAAVILSSLPDGLGGKVYQVKDDSCFEIAEHGVIQKGMELAKRADKVPSWSSYTRRNVERVESNSGIRRGCFFA